MIKWLAAINRYGQWFLAVIILLFIISGYGMTEGIMDRAAARKIHLNILPLPLFLLFLIHIFLPLRDKLTKWALFQNQKAIDAFVCIVILVFLALFLWLYVR